LTVIILASAYGPPFGELEYADAPAVVVDPLPLFMMF
jgi:hypothetical protein